MIDKKEVFFDKITIHQVGNPSQDEPLTISKSAIELEEDLIKDMLSKYFLSHFKDESMYQFQHESDLELNEIFNYASKIFADPDSLYLQSINIAKHLYQTATHPNIKGGELYVVFFSDFKIHDEFFDAIGIFKSENKERYLKVYPGEEFQLDCEDGININKLDKGVMIYNRNKEDGFEVSIVDNVNKQAEAVYWKNDFLNIKVRENSHYHTQQHLDICKNFCKDVLTEENEVSKTDQLYIMDKSVQYFSKHEVFDQNEFVEEVMEEASMIDSFQNYKDQYIEDNDINTFGEFNISQAAVKQSKKFFKSILKLDKNFHIYIHGNHDMIEQGFDDEVGMKYYKVFYHKES